MTSRNRRAKMKARIGIAAAVLVGGGAIGAVAVASSGHSGSTNAQSAGFSSHHRQSMPMSMALSSALTALQGGQQGRALTSLAQMAPMRNFTQTRHHHATMAMQRGIVELATRRFLVVKSANGTVQLWWIRGARIVNATSTTTAMTAMTGSTTAAATAMSSGNMAPATTAMAGSTTAASAMTAPAANPITITVNAGGQTITITIARTTATVSAPATTPSAVASATAMPTAPATASATAMPTAPATASATAMPTAAATPTAMPTAMPTAAAGGQMTRSTQSAFAMSNGLKRGDMVLVAGFQEHGLLVAKLVLFAAPTTTTTTPTATPTATTSVAPTAPATTNVAPSTSSSQFTGTHS